MEIYTIQNESVMDVIRKQGWYRPALPTTMDNIDPYYGYRICYRWMIDRLYDKSGLPLEVEQDLFDALRTYDDEMMHSGWYYEEDRDGYPAYVLPPSPVPHPVWGWQKVRGRIDGKPDMRSWVTDEPERVVRLRLEIPEERLLLSDFSYWHIPLNMGYLPESVDEWEKEDEAFDKKVISALSNDYPGLEGAHSLFSAKIDHLAKKEDEPVLYKLQQKLLDSWTRCLVDADKVGSTDNPIPFREDEWIDRETQCVFWEIREEDIRKVERFTTRKGGKI